MSYIEIFLLAIGLCFDTLALSVIGGAAIDRVTFSRHLKIDGTFGLVQGGFTFAGWALGFSFLSLINSFDHWIAFALLLFIGGKMFLDAFRDGQEEQNVDLLSFGSLFLAAVATSIDALAVGVSMAMADIPIQRMLIAFLIIGGVTAAVAAFGLAGGRLASRLLGKRTGMVGGLVLIAIGVKILMTHLVF
ncbi:MAG: manganese efflux pump [Bacteroidales bacterium]|nr:manganese efflux pump [Bacteroidales bacterium]